MSRCSYREMTVVFRSIFIIPVALGVILSIVISTTSALQAQVPPPSDRDFVIRDFHFLSGETMPELRIHYRTLGEGHGRRKRSHDERGAASARYWGIRRTIPRAVL